MNDKIKSALNTEEKIVSTDENDAVAEPPKTSKIITTEQELESFFIIKNMLKDIVDVNDIYYKDTESYFGILYKNNTRKWICRLILTANQSTLIIPDENKKDVKFSLTDLYDIENYKDSIIEVLNRYI